MTDNWISVQTTTETHSQKNETRKKNKKIQRNVHGKRDQDNTGSNIRNGHDLNKIQTVPLPVA